MSWQKPFVACLCAAADPPGGKIVCDAKRP